MSTPSDSHRPREDDPGPATGKSASRADSAGDPTSGEEMSHEPSKVVGQPGGEAEPAPPAEDRPPQ